MSWVKTASGIEIPEPAFDSGRMTFSTLVNAGRNADGRFIGQIIGNDKLKVELNWSVLTPTEFRDLLRLFDREQGGSFTNTYRVYDPRYMAYRSVVMYVGDRSGRPMMVAQPGSGHPKYWAEIQANLIEV